jgi:diguanylate cyclase (GGDEF)-like protein
VRAFHDRKKVERANAELFEQSIRDGLTGLFNRRKLDDVCREVYLKAERYNLDFTIIMMDIDYFKNINDNSGHAEGDAVLVELSALLTESIREVDVCGRWGGEEFMIISQETGLEEAYMLAERLRVLVEQRLFHGKHKVTSSFGLASYEEVKDLEDLIKTADDRLYAAKNGGRNRVEAGSYPPKKG